MSQITELEYATCKLEMLLAARIECNICLKYYHPVVPFEEVAVDWGITVDTLESYLSGTHPFSLKEICNIAYLLEISVKDLFDFD